jgi:RNA polymerase sigma-70 factor (ECF subfamily)
VGVEETVEAEAQLIERAKRGDGEAFGELIAPHHKPLREFIHHTIDHDGDADDVLQKVEVKAWQHLGSFQGRCHFSTWLFTITRRVIASHYRARHDQPIGERIVEAEGLSTNPKLVVDACDARERVAQCVTCITETLPLVEQLAVLLCDWYGYTDQEAARILGLTVGVFKHLLHRARVKLKQVDPHGCALVAKTGVPAECRGQARFDGCWPSIPKASGPAFDVELREELIDGLLSPEPRADKLQQLIGSRLNPK